MNHLGQDTGEWIVRHLTGEMTLGALYAAMQAGGYNGALATIKSRLIRMQWLHEVRIVRKVGRVRIFALPAEDDDAPLRHRTLAPVGIMPTRRHDPIAWMVVTSGASLNQLEAT